MIDVTWRKRERRQSKREGARVCASARVAQWIVKIFARQKERGDIELGWGEYADTRDTL